MVAEFQAANVMLEDPTDFMEQLDKMSKINYAPIVLVLLCCTTPVIFWSWPCPMTLALTLTQVLL